MPSRNCWPHPRRERPVSDGLRLSTADLTRVLYDWMPEGAYVSTDYDGNARRMTGADLAGYLVSRAVEYPDNDVTGQPTIDIERLVAALVIGLQTDGWNIDGDSIDEDDRTHIESVRSLADTVAAEYTFPSRGSGLCDAPLSGRRGPIREGSAGMSRPYDKKPSLYPDPTRPVSPPEPLTTRHEGRCAICDWPVRIQHEDVRQRTRDHIAVIALDAARAQDETAPLPDLAAAEPDA
jgi:hypothetical protein